MKRILFYKTSSFILNVLLITIPFAACKKQTSEIPVAGTNEEIATAKAGSKPNTIPVVYLQVTAGDALGDKITSDGGGAYVDGSQAVSAKFDQYGNFIFSCGTSGHGPSSTLVRWMNINFNSPVQVLINPPITGNDKVTAITTGSVAAFTFLPLQNLEVLQSECVGLTGGSGTEWVMNFHRTAEDVSGSPSAYAVFTRINSTQWTVTPVGSCSPNSNVCALRNGPGVLYGYYNMPFSLTLTKIP